MFFQEITNLVNKLKQHYPNQISQLSLFQLPYNSSHYTFIRPQLWNSLPHHHAKAIPISRPNHKHNPSALVNALYINIHHRISSVMRNFAFSLSVSFALSPLDGSMMQSCLQSGTSKTSTERAKTTSTENLQHPRISAHFHKFVLFQSGEILAL